MEVRVASKTRVAALVASLVLIVTTTSSVRANIYPPLPQKRHPATQVIVVGCVIREKEYERHEHKGYGRLFPSRNSDKEYVLVNGTRVTTSTAPPNKNSCSPDSWGQVFRLTGFGEEKAKPFVGHWVEIAGSEKKSSVNVFSVRDYVPIFAAGSGSVHD
jgi:hypothetical protein